LAPRSAGTRTMPDLRDAPSAYRAISNDADLTEAGFAATEAKARRALQRGRINIFLSHKHKDLKAVQEIRKVILDAGGDRLGVFMSENITKGEEWQDEIEKALFDSDWFLLIFTGTDDKDWSWCHHEAGIFRGMNHLSAKRIVVFYPPPNVKLPEPLKKYQSVKCQKEQYDDIYRFFENVFGAEPYPNFGSINKFFATRIHAAESLPLKKS
jgi:hypothetical protein